MGVGTPRAFASLARRWGGNGERGGGHSGRKLAAGGSSSGVFDMIVVKAKIDSVVDCYSLGIEPVGSTRSVRPHWRN